MNRRAEIALTAEKQAAFLADSRTIVLSTLDGHTKRVAIRVRPERIASGDDSKLRGAY
jgi:hypothetical protein